VKTLVLLILMVFASMANAQEVIDAFYSGVYLGMPINDCVEYYLSGNPPIANHGYLTLGSDRMPPGQRMIEFATVDDDAVDVAASERRVYVIYKTSDRKIVSILYFALEGRFLADDLQELFEINRRHGATHLVWLFWGHGYEVEEFEVTTAKEYKLEVASGNMP
jgi:hypothetical protein